MSNKKRYTWTVSVIAMVETDDPLQTKAYYEFEASITSIKSPNEDVRFAIFLYDVKTLTGYIKTSVIKGGKYFLKSEPPMTQLDFYGNNYQHLIDFFKNFVSPKKVVTNEIHKHFFITWGHGTGIGFFSQDERNKVQSYFSKSDNPQLLTQKYFSLVQSLRFLRSQLSLGIEEMKYDQIFNDNDFFPRNINLYDIDKDRFIADMRSFTLRCVTATQLAKIIQEGLVNDAINEGQKPQLDYMMCLTCYSQMIETGIVLNEVVKVMIAPETTISHFGYNYRKLFKRICKKPNSTDKEIANNIVNNYLVKYEDKIIRTEIDEEDKIGEIPYRKLVSFSAIRLKQYDIIVDKIKKLIEHILISNMKLMIPPCNSSSLVQAMRIARNRCLPITHLVKADVGVIDFNSLLMEYFRLFDKTQFSGVISDLFDELIGSYDEVNEFIIAAYFPASLAHKPEVGSIKTLWAGLFGVFLPEKKDMTSRETDIFNYIEATSVKNAFWDKTMWREFILATRE